MSKINILAIFKKWESTVQFEPLRKIYYISRGHYNNIITEIQALKQQPQWIALADQLPPGNGNYICCWTKHENDISILEYINSIWFDGDEKCDGLQYKLPTHWMVMPDKPGKDG